VETVRLLNLQQRSQIEVLLETLVSRAGLVPKDAYRIRDAKALSPQLQMIITRATSEGRVWVCWSNPHYYWLFTGEMSLDLARERGAPVLLVNRYDENGELEDSGPWTTDSAGKWQRCAD
jgi:hypothetical protein